MEKGAAPKGMENLNNSSNLQKKKGGKSNCNNYRGISLFPTCYKVLSNILLTRLSVYVDEIIGDHQCGFRRNRNVGPDFRLETNFGEEMVIQWHESPTIH